jgi:predicted metal-dependent hydrolase
MYGEVNMSPPLVRRLLVDLEAPFPVRWNGGDAFSSAFFNALSMSFPAGERYFIDSVRKGLKALPEARRQALETEVAGFIGQEATHRRIHELFNGQLKRLGLDNEIERRALRRIQANAHLDLRNHVAATAATEHFTAIFAHWMLRHPEALAGAAPRLQTLWLWHASEEAEHRSTAFDLYQALDGGHKWRISVFRYVTWTFLGDVLRQTVRNLWQDASLFRWGTWKSGWKLLMARDGMFRSSHGLWRDYLSPGFHPSQHEETLAAQWLQDNQRQFSVVGQAS